MIGFSFSLSSIRNDGPKFLVTNRNAEKSAHDSGSEGGCQIFSFSNVPKWGKYLLN
jgi:hypothetical protein